MYFDTYLPQQCCGCGACIESCPHKAISFSQIDSGYSVPIINESKCVSCGLCKKVCAFRPVQKAEANIQTYIAIYRAEPAYLQSASGAIFPALAEKCLERGGIVFGASMVKEDNRVICKHIGIEQKEDLCALQGSKYVKSQTVGVFSEIKMAVESGRTVLFSGTSCQVAALHSFLGKEYRNLLTVDLVCHGVPEDTLLQQYITYLENKNRYNIEGITFRTKDSPFFEEKRNTFVLVVQWQREKTGERGIEYIEHDQSAYYRLFLTRAGYRPNCYTCPFATLHKPADLTLGDFRPSMEELQRYRLNRTSVYSSVFVHTDKGVSAFKEIMPECEIKAIGIEEMLLHHLNLRQPSRITPEGERLYRMYLRGGFEKLQRAVTRRYRLKNLYRKMRKWR